MYQKGKEGEKEDKREKLAREAGGLLLSDEGYCPRFIRMVRNRVRAILINLFSEWHHKAELGSNGSFVGPLR
uniref:Uncharacterized protein n=1 Tax=Solanum lycopersicum TaxID=4081 RepID=A0A3Q7HY75_SOLLC